MYNTCNKKIGFIFCLICMVVQGLLVTSGVFLDNFLCRGSCIGTRCSYLRLRMENKRNSSSTSSMLWFA